MPGGSALCGAAVLHHGLPGPGAAGWHWGSGGFGGSEGVARQEEGCARVVRKTPRAVPRTAAFSFMGLSFRSAEGSGARSRAAARALRSAARLLRPAVLQGVPHGPRLR